MSPTFSEDVDDDVTFSADAGILLARPLTLADQATIDPSASVFPRWGASVAETPEFAVIVAGAMRRALVVAELAQVAPLPRIASAVALEAGVTLAEAQSLTLGARVMQQLLLGGTAAPQLTYTQAIIHTLQLNDALRNFYAVDAADALTVTGEAGGTSRVAPVLTDDLSVLAALSGTLVLRITTADGVAIDDVDALQLIYAPTVADSIEIAVGYVQPDGTFTTWVVNTRTAATTEYTNYVFNSFANVGNRYWGASETGLYVLDGNDDAGEAIIADIKTGLAQFGGSRFSTITAVYLGMRANGELRLRVIDGEGVTREYKVLAQSMRTAKVQTGKGIRTRYLAFELVSTGQDFDLDTIEMIPLVAQRRV